jgi:hypothetical protein
MSEKRKLGGGLVRDTTFKGTRKTFFSGFDGSQALPAHHSSRDVRLTEVKALGCNVLRCGLCSEQRRESDSELYCL